MIGRLLRRQRPPVRVTHYTPRQYLESRALGGNVVSVEHPGELPSPGNCPAAAPPPTTGGGGDFVIPHGRRSDGAGAEPPLHSPGAAAPTAFDCLSGHYDFGGNPNVND